MLFHGKSGSKIVDMMQGDIDDVNYIITDKWEYLALPFKGNYDMVLVLPKASSSLIEGTDAFNNSEALTPNYKDVRVWLPKFSIENRHSLNDFYPKLGSGVQQIAKISLDEEGVTAATATITQDGLRYEIMFDRPFLYSIVNRTTKTNLMVGAVVDF